MGDDDSWLLRRGLHGLPSEEHIGGVSLRVTLPSDLFGGRLRAAFSLRRDGFVEPRTARILWQNEPDHGTVCCGFANLVAESAYFAKTGQQFL